MSDNWYLDHDLPLIGLLAEVRDSISDELYGRLHEIGYADVRPAHGCVFGYIERAGGVRLTELADRSGLTKQAVGEAVADLERLGYVERVPDLGDGRAKIIRLTDRGVDAMAAANEIFADIESRFAAEVGEERFEEFRDTLRRLFLLTREPARAALSLGGDRPADEVDDALHGSAGREDLGNSQLLQLRDVVTRDRAADDEDHVLGVLLLEQLGDPRHERHVRAGENRQADRVRVLLQHRLDDLLGCLVEARVDDLHARVAQRAGNDLRPAIVPVEPGFGHHHSDLPAGHRRGVYARSATTSRCGLRSALLRARPALHDDAEGEHEQPQDREGADVRARGGESRVGPRARAGVGAGGARARLARAGARARAEPLPEPEPLSVPEPVSPSPEPDSPLLPAFTLTVPFMNGCGVQMYWKVPAVSKVAERLLPLPKVPVSKLPSSAVAEWATSSVLLQVTVSPTLIATDFGENAKSSIVTVVEAAALATTRRAGRSCSRSSPRSC